ncbi:MAG: hypothetical protein ACLTER_24425 [Ruminococcus sp.]
MKNRTFEREIRDTNVDTASIVERIAQMIYGDIFTTKKFRYGKYDFAFDQMVDGITVGVATGGMRLRFRPLLLMLLKNRLSSDGRIQRQRSNRGSGWIRLTMNLWNLL